MPQTSNSPHHGEVRKWRMERDPIQFETFVTETGDEVEVSYSGSESSVSERYCAHCDTWTEVRGVFESLKWLARHDKGDCVGEGSKQ